MRNFLCLFGIHKWRYLPPRKIYKAIRYPGVEDDIIMRIRSCVRCPRREKFISFPFAQEMWFETKD